MTQFKQLLIQHELSYEEASKLLGVSIRSVFYWCKVDPKPIKLLGIKQILANFKPHTD